MKFIKSFKKSIIISTFVLISVLTAAFFTYAVEQNQSPFTYREADFDVYESKATKVYSKENASPSQYSSLKQDWFPEYVRTKDQTPYGTCWAFATSNAIDISYAKSSESAGTEDERRTAPGHFAYFFYQELVDPLGNSEGDHNYPIGDNDYRSIGGNNVYSFQGVANRIGMALEKNAPYSSITDATPYSDRTIAYTASKAILLKENTGNYTQNVKDLIKEYGAVSTAIYWSTDNLSSYLNTTVADNTQYYNYNYYDNVTSTNHAVTLVGWDDSYSADNFKWKSDADKRNGAWILLNSWGANDGDRGIYYVSYADTGILNSFAAAYEVEKADSDELFFQYDGTVYSGSATNVANERAANVYTAPCNMVLKKIGFTEHNEGATTCKVSIYRDLTNANNPSSGTLVTSQNVTTTHPGYYTFNLNKKVGINKNSKFSIVIVNEKGQINLGIDRTKEKEKASDWIGFDTNIKSGQSFYGTDSWTDLAESDMCYRIKGIGLSGYKVTFNTAGKCAVPSSQVVEKGDCATAPEDPIAPACVFEGWYQDSGCTIPWNFDTNTVTKDITLYAKWHIHDNNLTHVELKPASLTKDGNVNYYKCESCGNLYEDESCTKSLDEDSIIIPQIKTVEWSSKTSYTYNGSYQKITATVKDRLGNSVPFTYSGTRKAVGAGTTKITFSGDNYTGYATHSFKIIPKGASIKSLKKVTKGFTVKWSKQSTKMSSKRITGYQIQIAKNKSFTSGVKYYKVKGYKKTSKKITKLSKKKTYYVRIRTYYGSYYSTWSATKSVKTK